MDLKTLTIEPYLTTLDTPFGTGDISRPNARVLVVAELSTHVFNKHANLVGYFKFKYPVGKRKRKKVYKEFDGRLWWEDGMQELVCHSVYIFTDDLDSGIFCGYNIMNDPNYFQLLGKLKDEDELTELFRKAFVKYGGQLGVQK